MNQRRDRRREHTSWGPSCLMALGYLEGSGEVAPSHRLQPHAPLLPRDIMLWWVTGSSYNTSLCINTQQNGRCPPGGWQQAAVSLLQADTQRGLCRLGHGQLLLPAFPLGPRPQRAQPGFTAGSNLMADTVRNNTCRICERLRRPTRSRRRPQTRPLQQPCPLHSHPGYILLLPFSSQKSRMICKK